MLKVGRVDWIVKEEGKKIHCSESISIQFLSKIKRKQSGKKKNNKIKVVCIIVNNKNISKSLNANNWVHCSLSSLLTKKEHRDKKRK